MNNPSELRNNEVINFVLKTKKKTLNLTIFKIVNFILKREKVRLHQTLKTNMFFFKKKYY